ncbi:hypothetical protein EYF80_008564 [Liparis tanakae]|uniref:Uncharacterized protein n=1 Tax=Liparis tanakae TaxID=230148 RepID=A0A4Z2ITB1_9TELE|nr:hypothetical protein EYF80_008564 [Liparis tanakae]
MERGQGWTEEERRRPLQSWFPGPAWSMKQSCKLLHSEPSPNENSTIQVLQQEDRHLAPTACSLKPALARDLANKSSDSGQSETKVERRRTSLWSPQGKLILERQKVERLKEISLARLPSELWHAGPALALSALLHFLPLARWPGCPAGAACSPPGAAGRPDGPIHQS